MRVLVKIFELQQQNNDITNYQSRIIECESFQDYLENIDESLSSKNSNHLKVYDKFINYKNQTVTFIFERKFHEEYWPEFTHFTQEEYWVEFTHFAQVIE